MTINPNIHELPLPGSRSGPCAQPCAHLSCAEQRATAASVCAICEQPIGYGWRFLPAPSGQGLVHALCMFDQSPARPCPGCSTPITGLTACCSEACEALVRR